MILFSFFKHTSFVRKGTIKNTQAYITKVQKRPQKKFYDIGQEGEGSVQ
jgi:hypothetical protein